MADIDVPIEPESTENVVTDATEEEPLEEEEEGSNARKTL